MPNRFCCPSSFSLRLPLGILLMVLQPASWGQETWLSLKTRNLEMSTTNARDAATREFQYLEATRAFFADTELLGKLDDSVVLKIIAFKSRAEYAPYAFRSIGGGYYAKTFRNDYIVLPDLSPSQRPLVAHEMAHFALTHAGLTLPVWLNEGVAELYSTLEPSGKQMTVGRPPAKHLETLRRQEWIPWNALFSMDINSPQYNEGEKVSMLYAQSWGLTHMLAVQPEYSAHFSDFLFAVSDGETSDEALKSVYHKSMAQVAADLSLYLRQKTLPVMVLDNHEEAATMTPAFGQPGDFDLQFALAEVLSSKPGSVSEAQKRLAALSMRYPDRPESEETLGDMALRQNLKADARRHFGLAVQRHSQASEVYYQDAVLEQESGASNATVSSLMRRALEMRPDFDEARLELGFLEYQDSHFESALALLSGVKDVPEDSEYDVDFAIADCLAGLDRSAEATAHATKALAKARTHEQKEKADELIARIKTDDLTSAPSEAAAASPSPVDHAVQPEGPVTNVWGRTKALICSSNGQKRLSIEANGRELIFDIDDPELVVRHATESYRQWRCGPLKPVNLTVVYRAQTGSQPGGPNVASKALELVF